MDPKHAIAGQTEANEADSDSATTTRTHVAEDHGLGDGDGSVDVAERLELLLLAGALHVVLLDGVQSLLLALQLDDVGVRDDALGEVPHRLLEGGREEQHLAVLRQRSGSWRRSSPESDGATQLQ